MKKLLLPIAAILAAYSVNAQCTELFFSEYVEGSHNNKALEIYNPTSQTIYLGNYRIIRWSNGSTTSNSDIRYVQSLSAADSIPPNGTFVAILDRRDPSGTGVDTILFAELLNIGNTYNAGFYSPCYTCFTGGDRVLPFNGDDAVALEKDLGGNNWTMVDLFGLIGERPQTSLGGTGAGWTDTPNFWDGIGAYWTKDQTLIRKPTILDGVKSNPGVPYWTPGFFNPTTEWDSLPRNTFDSLGAHTCNCPCTAVQLSASVTNESSYCNDDGAIDLTVTGGTPPYTYKWSNGAVSEDISGLAADSFSVTVTDTFGCATTLSAVISEPVLLSLSVSIKPDCGSGDGRATVSVSGGVTPYNYLWDDPLAQTNAMANNLDVGIYNVIVTDSAGCTITVQAIVQTATALIFTTFTNNPTSCGANDGNAATVVTSGTSPYSYQWSNGNTTSLSDSLTAGAYKIVITDANECADSTIVTLSDPAASSISFSAIMVICYGGSDGSVTVSASGGTQPYVFLWTNGQTDTAITGLSAASYGVTVTDSAGCASASSITITQPDPIIIQSDTVVAESAAGSSDGSITISVTGGTGTYSYNWSTGDSTQNISGLAEGTYTLIITDQDNCSSNTFSFNVPLATGISELSTDIIFTVYPNPFNNYLIVNSTYMIELIEVYDVLGQAVFSKPIKNKQNVYRLSLNGKSAGVYFLQVRFKDGTIITKKIVK